MFCLQTKEGWKVDVITKGFLPLFVVGALLLIGVPICESIDLFCDANGAVSWFWLFCFVGFPFGVFRTGIHFVGSGFVGFLLSIIFNFAIKGMLGGIFVVFYVVRACIVLLVAVLHVVFYIAVTVMPNLLLLVFWLCRWGIAGISTLVKQGR